MKIKHLDEIQEIHNLINIIEEKNLPLNQPNEFYNFAGLDTDETGLPISIYFDQCNSYIQYKHPLWVYINNGYNKEDDYIAINVDDLKVHCENKKLNIYQNDLSKILAFILTYKQEIYDIAQEKLTYRIFLKF